MKVLIVDDSQAMIMIIQRILKALDIEEFEIKTAEDGKSALEVINNWRADLILTDLHMPEMDGLQMMHAIVLAGLKIPVCLITTETSAKKLEQARAAGAKYIIQKPFEKEALEEVISSFCKQYKQRPDLVPLEIHDEPKESYFTEIANIQKILNHLCNKPIDIGKPLSKSFDCSQLPFVIGLYDDDEKNIRLVCFINHPAVCYLGASVNGHSLGQIDELLKSKALPKLLYEGARKVQKAFSVILTNPEDGRPLSLYACHLVRKPFARMKELCSRPADERLHLGIVTKGHGDGAIYLTRF